MNYSIFLGAFPQLKEKQKMDERYKQFVRGKNAVKEMCKVEDKRGQDLLKVNEKN